MVAENWTQTEDSIETFENLCGISDGGAKARDVINKIRQNLKLHFIDDLWRIDQREGIQNITDQDFEIALWKKQYL